LAEEELTRVAVNGVDVVHDGLVRAYLLHGKHGHLNVGDSVIAYDIDDEYDVRAVVEDIESNVAFLRADWGTLVSWDMHEPVGTRRSSVT
jgi:hypothetical protein